MKRAHIIPPALLLLVPLLWGCATRCPLSGTCGAPPSPRQVTAPIKPGRPYRIHMVRRGETLWHISKMYGVPMGDIVSVNHIADPSHLVAGTRLIIPSREYAPARKVSYSSPKPTSAAQREGFIWPVKGKILTYFGKSKRKISKGIVIQAPPGAPVRATKSGKVIYSGKYGPFGNTVILRHPGGYSSVYAHNRENLVKVGQWVAQGQAIATVGETGHVTRPCLEFEIRRKNQAVDPLLYLRSQ